MTGTAKPEIGLNRDVLPIETARLVLRDFTSADQSAWSAIMADPDAVRLMHFPPQSEEESHKQLQAVLATQCVVPRAACYRAGTTKRDGQ